MILVIRDVNRGSKNRNSLQIRVFEIEFSNSKLDFTFCLSAQAITQAAGDRASRFCANGQMRLHGPARPLDLDATAKARCRLETLAVRVWSRQWKELRLRPIIILLTKSNQHTRIPVSSARISNVMITFKLQKTLLYISYNRFSSKLVTANGFKAEAAGLLRWPVD